MKGYKVFNPDWTCRNFQYEVGKTYEIEGMPLCCFHGFHFCKELKDCFNYYDFNLNNKIAIIEALGDIDTAGGKSCTNKIMIIEELTWEEALQLVNTGKGCFGRCNSGDYNRGDGNSGSHNNGYYNNGNYNNGNGNSGNCNNGYYNNGNYNNGKWNSGNGNNGDWNNGDWNNGDWNNGNWNNGDCNRGDWNKTSFSSGVFNTKEEKIIMFNKPSNWTLRDWINSDAKCLLDHIDNLPHKWVKSEDMTDIEKDQHPEYATTGGYLKTLNESKCAQEWWDNLSQINKDIIYSLPNFDAEIFKEITGIDVNI